MRTRRRTPRKINDDAAAAAASHVRAPDVRARRVPGARRPPADDLLPMGNFTGRSESYTNREFYEFSSPCTRRSCTGRVATRQTCRSRTRSWTRAIATVDDDAKTYNDAAISVLSVAPYVALALLNAEPLR